MPYGIAEVISENLPGAQLTELEAKQIGQYEAMTYKEIVFTRIS
jgi:hypothetical protein